MWSIEMHAQGGTEFGGVGRIIKWGVVGLFLLLGAAIAVAIVANILAVTSGQAPSQMFYGPFFFPFGFVLFLFFLFFVFGWLFRPWRWGWGWGWRYPGPYGHHRGEATEILRQRYARGEISKEQFEQMSRDLEQL